MSTKVPELDRGGQTILVVTHEPEVFLQRIPNGWRLEDGVLRPLTRDASLRCP